VHAAAAAGPRAGVLVLQARLGSAACAYLWDHRVSGRALFPAAGFFELAAASVATLLGGARPAAAALAGAAIPAPLVLPKRALVWAGACAAAGAAAPELRCEVDAASGAVCIASLAAAGGAGAQSRIHMAAFVGLALAALATAPDSIMAAARLAAVLARWWPTEGGRATAAAPATAALAGPRDAEAAALAHPASVDSTLQLGALLAPGALRVPAGADLFMVSPPEIDGSREAGASPLSWASAVATAASAAAGQGTMAFNFTAARTGGGAAACRVSGLLARPLTSGAAPVAQAETDAADPGMAAGEMLYEVEYVAADRAQEEEKDSEQGHALTGRQAAAGCRVELVRAQGTSGGHGLSPAAAAPLAAMLGVLQRTASAASKPVAAARVSAVAGGAAGSGPVAGWLQGSQVAGVLRSAALEMPSATFSVTAEPEHGRRAALQLQAASASTPATDAYGGLSAGGTLLRPRLVPSTAIFLAGAAGDAMQLVPVPRGAFSGLVPAPVDVAPEALAPGQLGIRVQAVGLNFRDVLNVSGGGGGWI
jgi:hypothetical protein